MILKTAELMRNPTLIASQVDDELVMMDGEQGLYFGLNPVGAEIWRLLETPKTFDELLELLLARYEVASSQCEHALCAFLEQLADKELLLIE